MNDDQEISPAYAEALHEEEAALIRNSERERVLDELGHTGDEEEGERIDVSVQMIVPPKMIARVVGPGIEIEVRITKDEGFGYHDLVVASLGDLLNQAYEAATPKDDDA